MNTFMRKLGVLTLTLSVFLSASAADFEVDGICYNITDPEAKTVEVTYSSRTQYSGNITVPASVTHNGEQYTVTAISERAFSLCRNLTSINIPNSVTTIGESAFLSCDNLTSIDVVDDNRAYSSGEGILYDKPQKNLICCPPGKTGVVIIPNTVKTIRGGAFSDCTGLTSITIPNAVKTISNRAFYYCLGLTSITIPGSVTTIGVYAFSKCFGLTSINIPGSVTAIGEGAFNGCTGLTSITIPNSVTTIGEGTFYYCTSLTSINVDTDNQAYSSGNGILYNKTQTNLICCPPGKTGQVIIPNSVTTIGNGAFASCSGLTSIISFAVTPPASGSNVFYEVDTQNCTLYVPAESREAYRQAAEWSAFTRTENIVYISGIELNETEVNIEEGTTFSLTAEVQPADATVKNLQWETSNASCVTVDESGLLTAHANGTATITVRSYDGNAEATCAVTVLPKAGIEAVSMAANCTTEVFTLTGVKVARSTAKLPAGIYLVRHGSTVSKLLVR